MLKRCRLQDLAQAFQYFILDADGVIWEGNKSIGNAKAALHYLLVKKKTIFMVTNNSYKSRAEFVAKAQKVVGVRIPPESWYNSSRITAIHLKSKFPAVKSAYVIGGPGIFEELSHVGIREIKGMEDSVKTYDEKGFWEKEFKVENKPDCVIAGIDPGFSYYKLIYAANSIKQGATFIATNRDAAIKRGKYLMPGAGTMVAAVEKASGVTPIVIGKPETVSLEAIMMENKIPESEKSKMVMIGDRLETDILFAKNAGIKSCVVLTGVTSEKMLKRNKTGIVPDYWMDQIGFL